MVGFVNGHLYWLSHDKNWVIYVSGSDWIIGATVALGTPININAWIYKEFSTCPENEKWKTFWDSDLKAFVNTTGTDDIEIECLDRNLVTLRNGEKLSNDDWLERSSKEEVDNKIQSSSTRDLCGRRPWTNIVDYYKLFLTGHPLLLLYSAHQGQVCAAAA